MARYTDEYEGITGGFRQPRGMDPNFRGGYQGMRMGGGPNQAEYGRYRMRHPGDFQGSGGYQGGYGAYYTGEGGRYAADYRPEWHGGGLRDPRYDRGLMHDFNANSPMLRSYRGRYGRDMERPRHAGEAPGSTHQGYDPRYANRGVSSSGFSEGWARGPMRGAR